MDVLTAQTRIIWNIFFQMLNIKFLIIVLPVASSLTCSNYYDYTSDTVTCKSACPSGSTQISNKCLSPNQYIMNSEVHTCKQGWTNQNKTICCPSGSFILKYNGTETCQVCHGSTYRKGTLCCPGSTYADLTSSTPVCRTLKTGNCPSLTMKSKFKVCCPDGMFYHLFFEQCTSPSRHNCDPLEKICCQSDKMLEFIDGKYVCVSKCDWSSNDNFYCRKRFCDKDNQIKAISAVTSTILPVPLYALKGNCCYGNTISGGCERSADACEKRFINRGWSVCCLHGEFYDIRKRQCVQDCSGYLIYELLCVSNGSSISLLADTGIPELMSSTTLCNGRQLPQNFPICCPFGFYIDGRDGCKLCYGRIFKVSPFQVCCPFDHIYNKQTEQCEYCDGVIDEQGMKCCLEGQYVSYSTTGQVSCTSSCSLDFLYKGEYCCNSLGNSQCQIRNYRPTTCNPAYFISNSCQVCPSLCSVQTSMSNLCTTSTKVTDCSDQCPLSTVFYPQIGECLTCDTSCTKCSAPMSPNSCLQCAYGYIMQGGKCTKCDIQCNSCRGNSSQCSSCSAESSKPLLASGRCIQSCGSMKYWDFSQSRCLDCSSACSQCRSSTINQCTKCIQSHYLTPTGIGSCIPCGSTCKFCYANLCYNCQNSFILSNHICTASSCPSNSIAIYRPWLGHQQCVPCSSNCKTCSGLPENCTSCPVNTQYRADKIGVFMCYQCPAPCVFCSAQNICSTCLDGYYVNNLRCLACHSSCKKCIGGSDSQCLACFGESQLISGKCVGCSSSCSRCDIQKNCLECKSTFMLYNGNCAKQCPASTYPVQNQCYDCKTNCSTCSNQTLCISCSPTHYLQYNELCLQQCPDGYEQRNRACVKVVIPDPVVPQDNNSTDPNNNSSEPVKPDPKDPDNIDPNDQNYPVDPTDPTDNDNNLNTQPPGIKTQTLAIDQDNNKLIIKTIFQQPIDPSRITLQFFLLDKDTHKKTKLNTKTKIQKNKLKQASQTNQLQYEADIPDGLKLSNNALQTKILQDGKQFRDSSYLSSKSFTQFLFYDYKTNPLKGLQYVGLAFTILITIFSICTKSKGHFIAEEANTLILHMLNFIQVVYLFKFTRVHADGMYHFLNGFGFMHALFFPNFFYGSIPKDYYEYPAQASLIPDGNFIRGAGSSISFLLIALLVMFIAALVSFLLFKKNYLPQMPQMRKITRIGILFVHITFMNIMYTALSYLIQPYIAEPSGTSFQKSCRGVSIMFAIVIPLACIGIIYHFYKTYNSDVLQHYYTLRQGSHLSLIVLQCFIFAFSVGKPLICLYLIALQILWLIFNILLYRYGEGDKVKDHLKLIVCTICICISYLFLSLNAVVNWIAITVIVSIVVVVLIVYSSYQIVGLYYYQMFKKDQ